MLNSLGVKAGAVGVALLLWLHVVTEQTYTHTFHASLHPVHLSEDLIIANELPDSFLVHIRGKGKRLLWLMFSDLVITLDLDGTIQSRSRFRLKLSDVEIPRNLDLTVVEIAEPDYVDVDIDRLVEKTVPITPNCAVTPADGYTLLDGPAVLPDSVSIRGPRRFVEGVESLATEESSVKRAKRLVRQELAILPPDGVNVTIRPTRATIEIEVHKIKVRVIQDIPVELLHAPTNRSYTLDSSSVTLTIEGADAVIRTLTPDDFHVFVDYRQALRETTTTIVPTIETPPRVTWTESKPSKFKIIESES